MRSQKRAVFMVAIMLSSLVVFSPNTAADDEIVAWDPLSQPWGQYGREPGHSRSMPEHGETGLMTIENPAVNWVAFDSGLGADGYGVAIANLSTSISIQSQGAVERCGKDHLFAVMTNTDTSTGDRYLTIIEGDTAKVAWTVNLGTTKYIRSTPMIVDVDDDGKMEIVLAYDTDSSLKIDLWSPELSCDESGWASSGHSNERLWSWSDADLRIGITSPHIWTRESNHLSVTQPLVADLAMDGNPEVVVAAVDTATGEPTVIALPLTLQIPEEDWKVALDRGTHPSDPSFAALDDDSGAIVLTTVDSNSGNMWVWRIDGETGSLDWERIGIQNTDQDDDTPRLRLPGPVITQLDSDAAPEMILTLPVDSNGATDGMGAQFVAMELTSATELWRFRAKNGYADAEPIAIDTSGNGITDRVCWVTWYSDSQFSTERAGAAGCHDVEDAPDTPPFREWVRTLQSSSGNDNDEIAVSPPLWIDLDGESEPELLVAFGRKIFAFDGETGTPADIGTGWSSPIDVPHRTWAAPAVADLDGDGYLDILVGDALISEAIVDLAPLADERGIGFTPTDPDPGENVTITGQYSNIGTIDTNEPVDAVILLDGVEIKRHRTNIAEAVAPSGEGGPITFSVEIVATLGLHTVQLIIDPNSNITQSRVDNDIFNTTLVVLEPYVAQINTPAEIPRALPGQSETVEISLTSVGSRNSDWTLSYDDSTLPDGWSFTPINPDDLELGLERDVAQIVEFDFAVPQNAMGSDDAQIELTLTLDLDPSISTTLILPLEVERTRGLSLQGNTGLPSAIGYGRPGDSAHVWILIENIGNAQETTQMQWSSNTWDAETKLIDYNGVEQWNVELQPSSTKEFLIDFEVPGSTTLGDFSSTTLSLCIGAGDDEICESFEITVYASNVATDIPHIRTIPVTGLSWDIEANIPPSGILQWDMSQAGMMVEDWLWSATGDLAINGTMLELSGLTGTLHLDLPMDAPPNRHHFNQSSEIGSDSNLVISLHILQVYRADAEIIEPENGAVINVTERTQIGLRLENPGNGEDTFELTGYTMAGNLSYAPNVTFEIGNPERTLGPGSHLNMAVYVTLPADVPARELFQIGFNWTSIGDPSVSDSANITVEARPDHRWNVSVLQGSEIDVVPGQELILDLAIENIGNTDDLLTLTPQFELTYNGSDSSIWSADAINSSRLNVSEKENITLTINVPEGSWAGSLANLKLMMSSNDFQIEDNVSLNLSIDQVAGWRIDLSDTNLEVPPEGGMINLSIEQKGNAIVRPYFYKSGDGWSVELPSSGPAIEPGQSATISVNITPPSDAVAGEVGVISIMIQNGVPLEKGGSGIIVEKVPIRVGASPGIELGYKGAWKVQDGVLSWPTAWIENTGNDVAIMDLEIPNLPADWILEGEGVVVVAPGEIIGIPLQVQPSPDWDGNNLQFDISLTHPTLGEMVLPLTINQSDTVLVSSPVHAGRSGEKVSITIYNITTGDSTSQVTLPDERSNTTHKGMILHLVGIPAPVHTATCTMVQGDLSKLGIQSLTQSWANCTITANQDHALTANYWLRTNGGELLDSGTMRLFAGQTTNSMVSVSGWDPEPGALSVELLIVDSNGISLFQDVSKHVSRQSNWNVGLDSFIADSESITLGISRVGYQKMDNSVCTVEMSQDDGAWSKTFFVDIEGASVAPIIVIDRPAEVTGGSILTASISCLEPWDIDDNSDDNTITAVADELPLIEYQSSDLYWTFGIAAVLLVVAWFAGILTVRPKGEGGSKWKNSPKNPYKKSIDLPAVEEEETEVEMEIDDISFDENDFSEIETDIQPEPVAEPEPEPEPVYDIDDDTASGRLSAMRFEIETDADPGTTDKKDDISSRLDSFLKDR